ncbi:sulfatase-like hydrolase/transferase [Halosquirtibacter laminarini]|uniref:Sulfatase-like hydrolase/transferase n=1 Tax=Halosquirtibacter laminarini TaxID=3374600 RepID=A0AC61NPI6_9BACT|nr:sulfatase-like hydrolase/transferase [Prolixibacteraceae bacterium]
MKQIALALGITSMCFVGCKTVKENQHSNSVTMSKKSPNVILIMADDLGYGDVGFNGNKIIQTPNLDALSKKGVTFTNFYAGGPVCSPTRGTCLTGRHYARYGIYTANVGHLPKEEVTIYDLLKEKGYSTGHFGKWHLGTIVKGVSSKGKKRKPILNFNPPWEQNVDESFVTESAVATWNPTENDRYKKNEYYHNGVRETANLEGDDSRVVMDRVLPFIEDATKKSKPFFSVIWFHAPHEPVVAGPEYKAKYSNYTDREQNYFGCITALDDQVGRLVKHLDSLGQLENTIICFCSDNGPEGKHENKRFIGKTGGLRGRKRSLYCGGVGVPAFMVWPGVIDSNSQTSYITSTLDYLPTLVDGLSLSIGDDRPIDGVSLMPMFMGKSKVRKNPLPFMYKGKGAIINEDLKYIVTNGKLTEVYDLRNDRFEENNIIDSHIDQVGKMKIYMTNWNNSCRNSQKGEDYKSRNYKPVDKWQGLRIN